MRNEKIVTDMGQVDPISLLAEARFFCGLEDVPAVTLAVTAPCAKQGRQSYPAMPAVAGNHQASIQALAAGLVLLSGSERLLHQLMLVRGMRDAPHGE